MNVDNADNNALHSKELVDLVTGTTFKLEELKIGLFRYLEDYKPKTSTKTSVKIIPVTTGIVISA